MKLDRQIHPMHNGHFKKHGDLGKWHYIYYSDDKTKHVSLIKELRDFGIPHVSWQICSSGTCKECDDGSEWFDTKRSAMVRIKELLK